MYYIINQLRLLILTFAIIFLDKYMVLQVMIASLATIYVACALGSYHPFRELPRNYKGIVSEGAILMILDFLLFASDPVATTQ